MPLLLGRVRGNNVAGQGGRAPSFPRKRVGGAPGAYERQVRKIELDPIWTDERQRRTYGNGERYFLRKLRSSYGILTDESRPNSYVLCYGNGYGKGYVNVETRHKCPCRWRYVAMSRRMHCYHSTGLPAAAAKMESSWIRLHQISASVVRRAQVTKWLRVHANVHGVPENSPLLFICNLILSLKRENIGLRHS